MVVIRNEENEEENKVSQEDNKAAEFAMLRKYTF